MASKGSIFGNVLGGLSALTLATAPVTVQATTVSAPAAASSSQVHTVPTKWMDAKAAQLHINDVSQDLAGFTMIMGKDSTAVGIDNIVGLPESGTVIAAATLKVANAKVENHGFHQMVVSAKPAGPTGIA